MSLPIGTVLRDAAGKVVENAKPFGQDAFAQVRQIAKTPFTKTGDEFVAGATKAAAPKGFMGWIYGLLEKYFKPLLELLQKFGLFKNPSAPNDVFKGGTRPFSEAIYGDGKKGFEGVGGIVPKKTAKGEKYWGSSSPLQQNSETKINKEIVSKDDGIKLDSGLLTPKKVVFHDRKKMKKYQDS